MQAAAAGIDPTTGLPLAAPDRSESQNTDNPYLLSIEKQAKSLIEKTMQLNTGSRKIKSVHIIPLDNNKFKGTAIIEITATNSTRSTTANLDFNLTKKNDTLFELEFLGLSSSLINPETGLPFLPSSADSPATAQQAPPSADNLGLAGIDPATGLPLAPQDNTNIIQNGQPAAAQNNNGVDTIEKLKSLAEQGDGDAQYKLATCYDMGRGGITQNYQEALKWYRKAANQGIAGAQANLGRMYDDGKGVPKNYQEAVKWYKMASDNGDAVGQNNLGVMYASGTGVSLNNTEAAMWYRKSAEQGYAGGQLNLGCFYMYGTGVPRNYVEAYSWISLAAGQGFPQANDALEEVAKRMTQDQIAKAQERATLFVPKKAN